MPCAALWYRQMSSHNTSLESAIDKLQNAHKGYGNKYETTWFSHGVPLNSTKILFLQ